MVGSPVESVEHLDGDEHRQSHGGGVAGLKHLAVNALEHGVLLGALHEVSLQADTRSSLNCDCARAQDFI